MDEILVCELHGLPRRRPRRARTTCWIGDEAWELDYFLHENPELKSAAYVWLTDFVGWLPMPDGGEREAFLTADYNAEMIEHIARYPRLRDRALFVGEPDDVVPDRFGPEPAGDPGLDRAATSPSPGYVTGFDPAELARPRAAARRARLPPRTRRSASSPSAAPASAPTCSARVVAAFPEAKRARAGAADDRGRRARGSTRVAAAARRPRGARVRRTTSTGTSRRATSRSCRAA